MAYDGTLKFDTAIDASGFQKGIDGIGSIAAKGMRATGAILMGAASAIGAMGAAAIKVGSDFESAMSKVEAISGAAGSDLEALTQKAKEMGASTKFSATESANAFEYMAMAGWKTEDMLNGIEGIMNLAAASGEDLAATSDIVTDALTAFGMTAGDATHFADVLAQASSNANTNVGMMGETFKYVAPVAGALGYSVEDTALAIGLMANSGIKASQAGTALRSMLTRLAKPTEEAELAMEELGISIDDGEGNMKSFKEIMDDLRSGFGELMIPQDEFNERLSSLNSNLVDGTLSQKEYDAEIERLIGLAYGAEGAEKAKYAAMLAGQEAMSGLLAIVNASEDDFNKLTESIYSCDGAAAQMAETMIDNLQGQITILKSGLEGLGVSFYESVQEPLKDIAKEAVDMVGQLQIAFKEGGLEGMVTAFGDVLAQIVERVAGTAPDLIDAAVSLVGSFCDSLKNSPGMGEAAASLITSLVTGLISCAGEIWSTAVVLFTQLLAGLASQLPQIIETGKEAISQLARSLEKNAPSILSSAGAIASTLFNGLVSALPRIVSIGVDILNRLAEGIESGLPGMIPVAMNALVEFSGSLRENVGLLVDAGLNLVMALAQSLIDNLPVFIETVPAIITNIAGIINDNAPKLLACGIELIARLAMGLIEAIPALTANIPQIIQAIVSVITAFNWVSLGMNIIKFITDGIKNLAKSIPTAIKNIGQTAKDWMRNIDWRTLGSSIITFIVNGIKSLLVAVPNLLKSIGHTAVEFFKDIDWLDLGVNLVKGIIAGITGALDGLWTAVGDLCSGLLDGIKDFFGIHSPSTVMTEQGDYLVQGLVNGISNMHAEFALYLEETAQKAVEWGQQMLGDIQGSVQSMVDAAVTLIAQLPGKIWTWLVDTVNRTIQWGINLKNTAETWVMNTINSVANFFSQLPGRIWTWLVDTVNRAVQWGINLKNTAETWVANTINSVVNFFSTLPGRVWTWLVDTVNKTVQWGANLLSSAGTAAQNAVNRVAEWFSQMPGKVWSWLSDTISKVTQFGSDMGSKASEAARGFVSKITDGLAGLPGQMASIGSNIVNGIWNGISSGWSWLINKVKGLADSLFQGAKDALGINSPSRVFALEVGQWIPPGIGVGIERAMPDLQRQVDAEMLELAGRMQTAVAIETGGITVRTKASAEHRANTEYPQGGGDTYIDQHVEQENNYHVPVPTPSETSRANREAARKLLGGVK